MTKNNLNSFEQLFRQYFTPLCRFAIKYLGDVDESKEVVHEVFVKVWEKYESLGEDLNFKSYLYTSVRNRCLNKIRDNKKHLSLDELGDEKQSEQTSSIENKELQGEINYAIESLPERCREVFERSKLHGLKYAEIAEEMNISIKTVENQMSKALRLLRDHLSDFLILIFLWWMK